MRKSDLTKILKKTMLNVDYMLDMAIQEIGNVNLLKKEWTENIKDNTACIYIKTESFENVNAIIQKIICINKKEYETIFTDRREFLRRSDKKGRYGLHLLAEPDLKSIGFGDVTVEIFISTPILEKADELNAILNNLEEKGMSEKRHGESGKILKEYERIVETDRLGAFERKLEKQAQDRYLEDYKKGSPGPCSGTKMIYMAPW